MILNKQSRAGGITIPDFKFVLQSHSNKNSMTLTQKQTRGPRNSIEDQKQAKATAVWVVDKDARNTHWRKDILFHK
jgi:hypothetical protein